MLSIRLPYEIEARLARLAQATGRSKSFYARKAIVALIDAFEQQAAPAETRDGPFGTFTEWCSAADRIAYAEL